MLLILLGVVIFSIIWLVYYIDQPYGCENKIKFKSFKSFYDVNPQRWELYDSYVGCNNPSSIFSIKFKFGFFDYFKYKRFYKNQEKMEKNMAINEDYAKMIALVKSDIAALETQAKKEYEKGLQDVSKAIGGIR